MYTDKKLRDFYYVLGDCFDLKLSNIILTFSQLKLEHEVNSRRI
jgi:hypothetical protein